MSKLKSDTKYKYIQFFIFVLIILIGAFFRLYRIADYMTFLGDEGRDVLVVKRMIIDHKFTLLGPITSVGSMYMGPIYYYFMIPFLWVWQFDPVGPAVMVAIFSIATIILIYKTGSEFFNRSVGLSASFLYAISPLSIIYGRSSWNPNIVPFFSLLIIFSLLHVIVKKENRWFIVAGFSLGILFQLHYVTAIFIPIIFSCLFLIRFRIPFRYYLFAFIAFLTSYSPFLLFELRHGFVNLQAVWRFLLGQGEGTNIPLIISIWNTTTDVLVRIFWRLLVIENAELTKLLIIVMVIFFLIMWKNIIKEKAALLVILLWIIVGIFSFALYRGVIYDYYFGSLWTAPFLLAGIFLYFLWRFSRVGKIFALLIFASLIYFNLKQNPLKIPPSSILKNTKEISRFVFEKTKGKRYNFALIAGKNSDHAYRYFLELWNEAPVTLETEAVDPDRKTVTSQLYIVCEEKICKPLGHPLWEIAGFGQAEIVDSWKVVTAEVFHLKHYKNRQLE